MRPQSKPSADRDSEASGKSSPPHPRGGFFTTEWKWAVENEGVAPDIDVENWPKEVIAGQDPQLERAVQEALRMLKENPVNRLDHEPPPPKWGERRVPLSSQ